MMISWEGGSFRLRLELRKLQYCCGGNDGGEGKLVDGE